MILTNQQQQQQCLALDVMVVAKVDKKTMMGPLQDVTLWIRRICKVNHAETLKTSVDLCVPQRERTLPSTYQSGGDEAAPEGSKEEKLGKDESL